MKLEREINMDIAEFAKLHRDVELRRSRVETLITEIAGLNKAVEARNDYLKSIGVCVEPVLTGWMETPVGRDGRPDYEPIYNGHG
jgi:hypothetical protein